MWKLFIVMGSALLMLPNAHSQIEKGKVSGAQLRWPSPGALLAEPSDAELEDLNIAEVFATAKQRLKEASESLLTWQKAIDTAESDRAEDRARRGRLQASLAYAAAAGQMDLVMTPVIIHRLKAIGFHQGMHRDLFEKAQAAFNAAAADFKPGNLTSTGVLQARQLIQQIVQFKALTDALNDEGLRNRIAARKEEGRIKEAAAVRDRALSLTESARKSLAEGGRERVAEATKLLAEGRLQYSILVGLIAVQERAVLKGHSIWVQRAAFSRDGLSLASSSDNEVKVWDVAKGQERITVKDAGALIGFDPESKHFVAVMAKDVGGGGTLGNWTYTMNLCDVATGARQEKMTLKEPIANISPDGKLAVTGALGSVQLRDATNGREIAKLKGDMGGFINNAAFSADGKRVAAASSYLVKVWDTTTGKDLAIIKPQASSTLRVAISPDGMHLALAGFDGHNSLSVWDVATSQRVHTLAGHSGSIFGMSFSPDGKRLATGDADKLLKVWDVGSGQDLLTLTGHADVIYSVAFSPDGRLLASTGGKNDRSVRVWALDLESLQLPAVPKVEIAKKVEPKKEAPASKEEAIAAWKKAGLIIGWAKPDAKDATFSYPAFRQGGLQNDGELLAVYMPENKPIAFAQLPAPDEGFALFYRGAITEVTLKNLGAFKKMQILILMGVSGVSDSGLKGLSGLKELHTLNLDLTGIGDDGLRELAALDGLQRLSLGSCYQVTEVGLKHLSGSKNLQMLDVSHTRISEGGWKQLAGLKGLKHLKVASLDLSDDGMKAFAAVEQLESLDLTSYKVTNRGLKELANLKRLHTLKLFCTGVTDAGVKELNVLKELKSLSISQAQVTDASLKSLSAMKNLERLSLPGQLVTDAGMKDLAALKSLKHLSLSPAKFTDTGLKELAGLTQLVELHIEGSKVTDAGVAELAKALPELRIFR